MADEKSAVFAYSCTLRNLQSMSRYMIGKLSTLAETNIAHAPAIVKVIEDHVKKVRYELKVPAMFLIDNIIKCIKAPYIDLFSVNIVSIFSHVLENSPDLKRFEILLKLSVTWSGIFPETVMKNLLEKADELQSSMFPKFENSTDLHNEENSSFHNQSLCEEMEEKFRETVAMIKSKRKLYSSLNRMVDRSTLKRRKLFDSPMK